MKNFLRIIARAVLPEPKPPKAPKAQQTIPNYLGGARGSKISDSNNNITSLDIASTARGFGSMQETIKSLVLNSPDLSAAVHTKIKTAIPSRFTAIAYTAESVIDPEATKLLQTFIMRLNSGSYDYSRYTSQTDLRSVASSLLYDSFRYGSAGLELVVGNMRLPAFLKPFSARRVTWADDATSSYPIYKGKSADIPLNFPTIFYSSSIADNETPYSESPLQSVIQSCLWDTEFSNSLRRAATKNLLQRLVITIKSEAYQRELPIEVRQDKAKLEAHMNATIAALESQYAALNPEDSLVIFDSLSVDTIQDSNRSEDRSIQVLNDLISGRISSGSKTLPSIIGRGESSSAASTESLLFLKNIADSVNEINALLSRAFTLAIRLFGFDSYVQFAFEEVNLRPGLELASFKAMEQSTVLEQLSYGFISDEEASIKLTGTLPGPMFKPLSGTGFKTTKPEVSGNDYSNTSVGPSDKPDSTQSQKDNGDTKRKGVKSQ